VHYGHQRISLVTKVSVPVQPIITPRSVGPVHLGATVKSLHRRGLIGGLRKGCERVESIAVPSPNFCE
jgi:hypothetical protein